MLRSAIVACLLGSAVSQSVTGPNDVNLFALRDDADATSEMLMWLQDMNAQHTGIEAAVETMTSSANDKIAEIQMDMEKEKTRNMMLKNRIAAMQSSVAAKQAAFSDIIDKNNDKLAALTKSTNQMINDALGPVDDFTKSVPELTDEAKDQVSAATDEVMASTSNLMPADRHVFSGRATGWGDSGGWRDFECNLVEVDTASPWFKKKSNTRFTMIKEGVVHILWWAIQRANRRHGHNRVRRGPGHWIYEHSHNWMTDNAWEGAFINMYWRFTDNEDFWTVHYNTGGHRWHHGPSNPNDGNSYNRIFIEYVGQAPGDWKMY